MKERRYTIYLMNNKSYNIDEADLQKLKDNAGEMLVQLKQVMVHPPSVTAIEPYFEPYIAHTVETDGRMVLQTPTPPRPLDDLFKHDNKQLT